jgi:hypothetical protein
VGVWENFLQDFGQTLLGAIVAAMVTAVVAFVGTRVQAVREWLFEERRTLMAAFFVSVIVAGAIGLFLRHLTWRELSGFAILAGGRIDLSKASLNSCGPVAAGGFEVAKLGQGDFRICFSDQFPENSFILAGPLVGHTDSSEDVAVQVINSSRSSFEARTLYKGSPADKAFGFLVLRKSASPD